MLKSDWLPLIIRTYLSTLFVAALCLLGNLLVVAVLRWTGHDAVFTSFYAIVLLCPLLGLMPFTSSPLGVASRAFFGGRRVRIGIPERITILALMAVFVVLASMLSQLYQQSLHVRPDPYLPYVTVSIFAFVALIVLIRNWRYMKWEAQQASGED